jgi:hypothetical protein
MAVELHFWMIPSVITVVILVIGFMPSGGSGGNLGSAIGNAAMSFFMGLVLIGGALLAWLLWALSALIFHVY